MYNKKKTLEGLNKLFTKYKVLKMKDLKVSLPIWSTQQANYDCSIITQPDFAAIDILLLYC